MTEFPRNQSLFVPNPLFSHNSLCFCVSYLNILPKQRLNSLISSYFFARRFLSVVLFPAVFSSLPLRRLACALLGEGPRSCGAVLRATLSPVQQAVYGTHFIC